jgi:hypothetical protein
VNEQDIIEMKVDKNQDIIFMSVGMYKMFMANGTEGLEAKQLYDHLMFTARLQETNLIHASPGYISNGLAWGKAIAQGSLLTLISELTSAERTHKLLKKVLSLKMKSSSPSSVLSPVGQNLYHR